MFKFGCKQNGTEINDKKIHQGMFLSKVYKKIQTFL